MGKNMEYGVSEMSQQVPSREYMDRAHRRPQAGVEYELRVIHGSGGMLELVEKEPRRRHWFMEWARAMQYGGWTL